METYGVGKWREMREALLPDWEEVTLRGKAARALGCQSLARYGGWKGDRCGFPFQGLRVIAHRLNSPT